MAKKKPGRKPRSKSLITKNQLLTIRMTEREMAEVGALALEARMPVSRYVRSLLAERSDIFKQKSNFKRETPYA